MYLFQGFGVDMTASLSTAVSGLLGAIGGRGGSGTPDPDPPELAAGNFLIALVLVWG